jgi:hypothetical protein
VVRGQRIRDLDGVEAGRELLRLHTRARSALGQSRVAEARSAPCDACGAYALVKHPEHGQTVCQVCRHVLSEAQYDAWCALLTGSAG